VLCVLLRQSRYFAMWCGCDRLERGRRRVEELVELLQLAEVVLLRARRLAGVLRAGEVELGDAAEGDRLGRLRRRVAALQLGPLAHRGDVVLPERDLASPAS
jgi:hypothetical protein